MAETYKVQSGDNLIKIARKYNVSLDDLIKANNIKNPNIIHPEMVIKIPGKTLKKAKAKIFKHTAKAAIIPYTIKPGDYLSRIAADKDISLKDLLKVNPKLRMRKNLSLIFPGEIINIPSSAPSIEAETAKPTKKAEKSAASEKPKAEVPSVHTVAARDNLYGIARANNVSYNALIAANPQITNPNIIHIGDEIKIPPKTSVEPKKEEKAAPGGGSKAVAPSGAKRQAAEVSYINFNENFGKNIALTFDDGPDPVNTPIILDILKKHKIKATFFVLGRKAKEYPGLIRRIVEEGHTLGNHTYNHPQRLSNKPGSRRITELREEEIRDEMVKTQEAVDQALKTHYPLRQFRPPGGHCNTKVEKVAGEEGITEIVKWNVTSNDWTEPGAEKIISNVENGVKEKSDKKSKEGKGGVILFHDNHSSCIAKTNDRNAPTVLEKIIQDLQNEGYKFKTVDELIKMKNEKKKA